MLFQPLFNRNIEKVLVQMSTLNIWRCLCGSWEIECIQENKICRNIICFSILSSDMQWSLYFPNKKKRSLPGSLPGFGCQCPANWTEILGKVFVLARSRSSNQATKANTAMYVEFRQEW